MFEAWSISIFVGFDFHNVDALRLKCRKELLSKYSFTFAPGITKVKVG